MPAKKLARCEECGKLVEPRDFDEDFGLCPACGKRLDQEAHQVALDRDKAVAEAAKEAVPRRPKHYPLVPYEKWATAATQRWIDCGHTFGVHVMKNIRDGAWSSVPKGASPETRQAAAVAIQAAIGGFMQLFDGVFRTKVAKKRSIEYVLQARVVDEKGKHVETIELAPGGDGLCMGFAAWWENDFYGNRKDDGTYDDVVYL